MGVVVVVDVVVVFVVVVAVVVVVVVVGVVVVVVVVADVFALVVLVAVVAAVVVALSFVLAVADLVADVVIVPCGCPQDRSFAGCLAVCNVWYARQRLLACVLIGLCCLPCLPLSSPHAPAAVWQGLGKQRDWKHEDSKPIVIK